FLGFVVESGPSLAFFVDRIFEISRLGIRDRTTCRGDGDAADVTGVGSLVVLVIEPDIKTFGRFPHEAELHRDLEVLPAFQADRVDPGVIVDVYRFANENPALHDALALVVAPSLTKLTF